MPCMFVGSWGVVCGESCSVPGLAVGQVSLVARRAPFSKPIGEALKDGSGKVDLGQTGRL